ncbi:hypothetical protein CJ030_MR3G011084 [Morella rubra]|uniref:Uncharacterized protein n=1 Tax=Morella rubra TaxID=262757 RepID=A0A6A1W5R0_9ROSI|nr:hypothetical protein CJ030_MR3G011084 [Morella rubra]
MLSKKLVLIVYEIFECTSLGCVVILYITIDSLSCLGIRLPVNDLWKWNFSRRYSRLTFATLTTPESFGGFENDFNSITGLGESFFLPLEKRPKLNPKSVCKRNTVNRSKLKKSVEEKNLIEFYKRSHIIKRDDNFINDKAEQTYVFHNVLGHKSRYTQGLESSVIPTPSPTSRSAHVTHLTQQVEKYKSKMETFKEQYLEMKENME